MNIMFFIRWPPSQLHLKFFARVIVDLIYMHNFFFSIFFAGAAAPLASLCPWCLEVSALQELWLQSMNKTS